MKLAQAEIKTNNSDIINSLADVMTETFTTYKGVTIEKTKTGYKVFGVEVATKLEAKMKIELAYKNFSNL